MFDDVSGRSTTPEPRDDAGAGRRVRDGHVARGAGDARVVLDLCTGSGVAVRRTAPGRLVLGMDVSFRTRSRRPGRHDARMGAAPACSTPSSSRCATARWIAITVFGVREPAPASRATAELSRACCEAIGSKASAGSGLLHRFHAFWALMIPPRAAVARPECPPLPERVHLRVRAGPQFTVAGRPGRASRSPGGRRFLLGDPAVGCHPPDDW